MRRIRPRALAAALGAALALAAVTAPSATAAGTVTSGWNNWSCTPSSSHPEPVVLVHGLGANASEFATLAPTLVSNGYCVFSLTYGTTIYGDYVGGLQAMEDSAADLGDFVDKVLDTTGAAKVDIVGHSEGSTVPAQYLKYNGGAAKVKHFIGFGTNYHGTTLQGLTTLATALNLNGLLTAGGCAACAQYGTGSDFITTLNEGGAAVSGPTYTNIMTKYDQVVTPYTSGALEGSNVTNIVLQDVCKYDYSGHLGLAVDPNIASLVLKYLDPDSNRTVSCVPFYDLNA